MTPPLTNSGTRLRRSGARRRAPLRATSMPTATRQRTSDTAEPSASAASLRPSSRSMSSTFCGHPPRQSAMHLVGVADQQRRDRRERDEHVARRHDGGAAPASAACRSGSSAARGRRPAPRAPPATMPSVNSQRRVRRVERSEQPREADAGPSATRSATRAGAATHTGPCRRSSSRRPARTPPTRAGSAKCSLPSTSSTSPTPQSSAAAAMASVRRAVMGSS